MCIPRSARPINEPNNCARMNIFLWPNTRAFFFLENRSAVKLPHFTEKNENTLIVFANDRSVRVSEWYLDGFFVYLVFVCLERCDSSCAVGN